MKNFLLIFTKHFIHVFTKAIFCLVALSFFGISAFSQIATTSPASRCGEGILVLSATATTGTIKWYDVPFYGTPVATGSTFNTPSLSVTKTYYVDAVDPTTNCSLNSGSVRVQVIATISASSIQAIIFYESNTFCKSVTGEQAITRTGTAGGTYTSSPVGLTLNAASGSITPSSSSNGDYTIIYTVVPGAGCLENPASTNVTITDASIAPSISYTGTPFCTSAGMASVVQTGATGGIYSATPTGLDINSTDGTITPVSSQSGTYTVRYFVPGLGGCSPMTATTTLVVLQLPSASISYDSPFTKNQTNQPVVLTGSGVYTGGTFTYTGAGSLTLNASTGVVDPSTSTAGIYSVTYTLAAVTPCAQVTTTTSVQILALPTATIGSSQAVCQNSTAPNITFTGAAGTAPYTFTYTINSGSNQTITTTSGNSVLVPQPTTVSGTYLYTLVRVSDATGSTQLQTGNATITVTALPVATFNYAATPYCSNGTNPTPTMLDGGIKGTFSSTPGLQFVSASTGEIDITGSTAGTYTVTNRIAAAGGCPIVEPTTSVTITSLPVASFHYASAAYCKSAGTNPDVVFDGGVAGVFTSVPAGVQFISGNPGRIDLAATTAGTYQIVNTIAAANGCAVVSATVNSLVITAVPSSPSISYSGSPYCNSIVSAQPVELTGTSGGTYSALPSGLTLDPSTGSVTPNSSTPGTYTVTYSVGGGGGCSAVTTTASVVVNETPAVSNLNAYPTCSGTSPNIELTASMPSTFSWTLGTVSDIILDASVSTGSPTHINQVLSNISYTDAGTVPYLVTPVSTANSCVGAPFTLTVTVNPNPQITVSNPAAICAPATVNLTAGAVTTGSTPDLTITYWTDNAATLTLTNPNAVATSGTYYIKGTTASGCYSSSEVTVIVDAAVTVANAGADQAQCNSGSFTLAGSAASVGTGTWTLISGTATITSLNSETSGITGVPTGSTAVLRWTIVNGTCSTQDDVSLINNPLPSAPATATHTTAQTQIVWNWSSVSGATGYRWNTTNVYSSATDMGTLLTNTETGLTCNTAYTRYIWAYNASGCVSVVTTLTQTTSSCISAPSLTTSAVSNIGSTTVTLNGDITAINGANVTTRGFKYSTTSGFDPATSGTNISESGTFGAGTFSLSPSGLTTITTYYAVAYATNSVGTSYGTQVSFITLIQTDFSYTGGQQTFVVPAGVTSVTIEAWGAQGGTANTYAGGLGGYAKGTVAVTPGQTIYIYIGQVGQAPSGGTAWNGGGFGICCGAGGGGCTDARIGGTNLSNRVIVAGGGGGGSLDIPYGPGGAGGGSSGGDGNSGLGGTQSSGYALGEGESNTSGDAAGGGGGYYGGFAGHEASGGSGGGGSGYIGGVTSGITTAGVRSGNGQIKIAY